MRIDKIRHYTGSGLGMIRTAPRRTQILLAAALVCLSLGAATLLYAHLGGQTIDATNPYPWDGNTRFTIVFPPNLPRVVACRAATDGGTTVDMENSNHNPRSRSIFSIDSWTNTFLISFYHVPQKPAAITCESGKIFAGYSALILELYDLWMVLGIVQFLIGVLLSRPSTKSGKGSSPRTG
jgi:hypothetical protein